MVSSPQKTKNKQTNQQTDKTKQSKTKDKCKCKVDRNFIFYRKNNGWNTYQSVSFSAQLNIRRKFSFVKQKFARGLETF